MAEKRSEFQDRAEQERLEAEAKAKELIASKLKARAGRPGCDTCRAFSEPTGECRRKSPGMVPVPQWENPNAPPGQQGRFLGFASAGLYPATNALEWCVEHQAVPRPAQPPKPVQPVVVMPQSPSTTAGLPT